MQIKSSLQRAFTIKKQTSILSGKQTYFIMRNITESHHKSLLGLNMNQTAHHIFFHSAPRKGN